MPTLTAAQQAVGRKAPLSALRTRNKSLNAGPPPPTVALGASGSVRAQPILALLQVPGF